MYGKIVKAEQNRFIKLIKDCKNTYSNNGRAAEHAEGYMDALNKLIDLFE